MEVRIHFSALVELVLTFKVKPMSGENPSCVGVFLQLEQGHTGWEHKPLAHC